MGSSSNQYAPRLPQQETKSSTKHLAPTDLILGPENLLKTGFAQKGLPSSTSQVCCCFSQLYSFSPFLGHRPTNLFLSAHFDDTLGLPSVSKAILCFWCGCFLLWLRPLFVLFCYVSCWRNANLAGRFACRRCFAWFLFVFGFAEKLWNQGVSQCLQFIYPLLSLLGPSLREKSAATGGTKKSLCHQQNAPPRASPRFCIMTFPTQSATGLRGVQESQAQFYWRSQLGFAGRLPLCRFVLFFLFVLLICNLFLFIVEPPRFTRDC